MWSFDFKRKEQYYIDKLNPNYNTLKIAESSSGHIHTEETKAKISNSLKGLALHHVKEKSALYDRVASQESKMPSYKVELKKFAK